jgi:hypothetical protein
MAYRCSPTLSPSRLDNIASTSAARPHLTGIYRTVVNLILLAGVLAGLPAARASIVTITITGTVSSGVVVSGGSLVGQAFTLVATFDDTKGLQQGYGNCGTDLATSDGSSPGTAILQIGALSWSFGNGPSGTVESSTTREVPGCPQQAGVGLAIEDNVAGSIEAIVTPVAGVLTDMNWEHPFSTTQIASSLITFDALGSAQRALGILQANSITVGGPMSSSGPTGLRFFPVKPCRVADTRNATGSFGGPELGAGSSREFDIPQSACAIPSSAVAYSLNVTVVPDGALSYLSLWPSGQAQPAVSTLNSDGRIKASAAITAAGTNGGVNLFVSDPTHVILDISGYFVPAGTASALAFYTVAPCRIADTRNATAALGGPSLAGGVSRDFPVLSSSCGIPSDAKAYSLNVTAIPKGPLAYLSVFPSGQALPLVSTLNAPTGAVEANAAIVPAGADGEVSVFAYNDADVVLDVNGYFAEEGATGLSLYTVPPCRVLDTRTASQPLNGTLAISVEGSTCAPPSTAQAYVVNATVVPSGSLAYLTLWPVGETQPLVSTLNAGDGAITSNMAIVPTTNGSINVFSYSSTHLILDLSSYFAP